jgi:hypothetical protein
MPAPPAYVPQIADTNQKGAAMTPAQQESNEMAFQRLTLMLDGITAGDYLQWVRGPEPPALGQALQSIDVHEDPLGQIVEALLSWEGSPPSAVEAAPLAGLPLIPEVTEVDSEVHFPEPAFAWPQDDARRIRGVSEPTARPTLAVT